MSRSMISLIERGESSPTAVVLDKLAAGLGVTLGALFNTPASVSCGVLTYDFLSLVLPLLFSQSEELVGGAEGHAHSIEVVGDGRVQQAQVCGPICGAEIVRHLQLETGGSLFRQIQSGPSRSQGIETPGNEHHLSCGSLRASADDVVAWAMGVYRGAAAPSGLAT